MKIKILILLTLIPVKKSGLEDFLGKHIHEIKDYSLVPVKGGLHKKTYRAYSDSGFLGKSHESMHISTDLNDTIQNISLSFDEIIDETFYNQMVERYDVPDMMLKIDEIITENEEKLESGIVLKEGRTTSKECTFKEEPLLISWNKKIYNIQIQINRKNKRTTMIFSKKSLLKI